MIERLARQEKTKVNTQSTTLHGTDDRSYKRWIQPNWTLSELEFVRIRICRNWNLSEF